MASANFTPGPWTYTASGFGHTVHAGAAAAPIIIADHSHGPEREANARLIASAPDLLAALKAMLDTHGKPMREEWINDAGFKHAKAVDAQARAAIAKAEGAV